MALRAHVLCFECRFSIRFYTQSFQTYCMLYYKQWLNSILLSSLLKLWVLVLNYKSPNECVFLLFLWLYLWFPWNFFAEIFQNFHSIHRLQRDTNFKHEKSRVCTGGFFDFCKFMSFTAAKKLFLQISLKNELRLLVCQILQNFTEGNARKFTVTVAFCAHVDVIKYRKNTDVFLRARADYLSFRPQRACDRKTIGSHLKM